MSDQRDYARPRLQTVNEALGELKRLAYGYIDSLYAEFESEWNEILDKHDLNYNDPNRWDIPKGKANKCTL